MLECNVRISREIEGKRNWGRKTAETNMEDPVHLRQLLGAINQRISLTWLCEGFLPGRWCRRALGIVVHIISSTGARVPAHSGLTSNSLDHRITLYSITKYVGIPARYCLQGSPSHIALSISCVFLETPFSARTSLKRLMVSVIASASDTKEHRRPALLIFYR